MSFSRRHIGSTAGEQQQMLDLLGYKDLDDLTNSVVPKSIYNSKPLNLDETLSESELLERMKHLAGLNQIKKTYIGQGYSECIIPTAIKKYILESPGWYSPYTPYQAEISQGRLEALFNFQTMVAELTDCEIANASLLDEGTAAAEAMLICRSFQRNNEGKAFFVSDRCFPQTIEVVCGRAAALGIEVIVGRPEKLQENVEVFGGLLQYPGADGELVKHEAFVERLHKSGALAVFAVDLLALTLFSPPASWGADITVGSAARFGVNLGYGGPSAAFLAAGADLKRLLPGRIVGMSKDVHGKDALRLALQTREQHIRRERATSNICTAQALLATVAGFYGIYHGPAGLTEIAASIHRKTRALAATLKSTGFAVESEEIFDTITISETEEQIQKIFHYANSQGVNLCRPEGTKLSISLHEGVSASDLGDLVRVMTLGHKQGEVTQAEVPISSSLARAKPFMTQAVFNSYHSELEFLRYVKALEAKDVSLADGMIPLGSCTMKLNAAAELECLALDGFTKLHPFVPREQAEGYNQLIGELESDLAYLTGMSAASLQPNSGAQGEYAGLLVIKAFHNANGSKDRDVCLIPTSAHGTNPASAVLAGFRVVTVKCNQEGKIDLDHLDQQIQANPNRIAAMMVTYPSTFGVFDLEIGQVCERVHAAGGQIYMDGANMNAQMGLAFPGRYGVDVCHLNLHKTFCIPHGGGGPGMGPIAVRDHLQEFLPGHKVTSTDSGRSIHAISAAPYGSASILPISWAFIKMMGNELRTASQTAILHANYLASKLSSHYPVLFRGENGLVAHECILDLRSFKKRGGVEVEDVAKRLMDYGFHAPTMSFPIPGTLMVEPTESEGLSELDRFVDAMVAIRGEIEDVCSGRADRSDNVLKNAPHTLEHVSGDEWPHAYSRTQAAFPVDWCRERKRWPTVGRVDNALGDRQLICTCGPVEDSEVAV